MQVPYAKKWQKEVDKLRKIALDCDLVEERKWSKACFTFLKKNVAIVIPLKESCAFSFFFKGAPLKDPVHILEKIGEHTGWALDKIYLGQTDLGVAIDPEKLPLRGHRNRGGREEG